MVGTALRQLDAGEVRGPVFVVSQMPPLLPVSKQPLSLVKQRSNQAAENSQAALDWVG